MALPSISTSPVEKLRWKFWQSSLALYRHHSTKETRLMFLSALPSFLRVIISTSAFSPFGTKYRVSAFSPPFRKAFGTCVLLLDVQFVVAVTHVHCLAYQELFGKYTQFGLLLQAGEQHLATGCLVRMAAKVGNFFCPFWLIFRFRPFI